MEQLRRIPILTRLLIANGLVVVLGASAGTMITLALADHPAVHLASIFAVTGVALSLAINYVVLRIALRPLDVLTSTVDEIRDGQINVRAPQMRDKDPDIGRLADALNAMLERLAAHTATIEANREQLRILSTQVITAQEEERKRIARELHDETSQSIASLLIALERAESSIPEELPEVRGKLTSAHNLACKTLEGIRTLVADLRPLLLDDLGLVPAIRWYAREHLESQGIDVDFQAPSDLPRLPPALETALFRISQEAVNNIVRHADASQVRLILRADCSCTPVCKVTLLVEDDGIGFDSQHTEPARLGGHFGLFGMQERAVALGGTARITSAIGKGTRVEVDLPLEGQRG